MRKTAGHSASTRRALPPHVSMHPLTVALLTAVACAAAIANVHAAAAANDTPMPQAAPIAAAPPCTPSGPYEPICGLQAPEDLERLPGGGRLLVSQMRGPTHLPDNNIAELDLATRAIRVLPVVPATRVAWADAGCTEPDPKHDVHGFDLSSDAEDNLQLLVVNHGSRESIEIFQVAGNAGDRTLQWRGCVVTPADVRLNDVAARPQGGFIATVMGEAKHFSSPEGFKFLVSGENTGYLLEWTPDGGFRKLPGSEAAFPNGIVIGAAGRRAYFAAWTGRKVYEYDLRGERIVAEAALDFMPDNLSWSPDGAVLTAGILDMEAVNHCLDGRTAFCTSAFRAARIDPMTMTAETIVDGPSGVLGGASVAVQDGDWIYVGSWAGDRIVRQRVPRP